MPAELQQIFAGSYRLTLLVFLKARIGIVWLGSCCLDRFDMAEKATPAGQLTRKILRNVKVRWYSFFRKNAWRMPSTLQNRIVRRNRHRSPLDDLRNLEKVCPFNNCSDCTPVSWTRQAPRGTKRYKQKAYSC